LWKKHGWSLCNEMYIDIWILIKFVKVYKYFIRFATLLMKLLWKDISKGVHPNNHPHIYSHVLVSRDIQGGLIVGYGFRVLVCLNVTKWICILIFKNIEIRNVIFVTIVKLNIITTIIFYKLHQNMVFITKTSCDYCPSIII